MFPTRRSELGCGEKGAQHLHALHFLHYAPVAVEYGLEQIVPYLEVPLDSQVATRLRGQPEGARLPAWKSIASLTEECSRAFQDVAARVACRMKVHRADLDVFYWAALSGPENENVSACD